MDLNLQGRRALVTCSTAVIGLAIVASLGREGARVIVTGRVASPLASAITGAALRVDGGVVKSAF
jgi:NAD(P)-dependent dehydrogenase (short-subunit alcohol dehydrogenase family)